MKNGFLIFMMCFSMIACSEKNRDQRRLGRAPASIEEPMQANDSREAEIIKDYAQKLIQLDSPDTRSRLQSEKERTDFQVQVDNLRASYDQAVGLLEQYEQIGDLEKPAIKRELDTMLNQMKMNWEYILINFNI